LPGRSDSKAKIKDLDSLKANFLAIGKACGGCHETFRVKNG
jgi:cytochrome c556